jgi:hypothetical protein
MTRVQNKKTIKIYRFPSIFQWISLPEVEKSWVFASFSARALGSCPAGTIDMYMRLLTLINTASY